MHRPADLALWTGRVDGEEGPRALRWHQAVRALLDGAAPGTALLGFACDAGVARNHGRTGAAEGPARSAGPWPTWPGIGPRRPGTPATWW
jgi:formiminoglutamase